MTGLKLWVYDSVNLGIITWCSICLYHESIPIMYNWLELNQRLIENSALQIIFELAPGLNK